MCYALISYVFPVSPYDPDSRFYMSSLASLETAGIKVVTALRDNIDRLEKTLGLHAIKEKNPVEYVMELWECEPNDPPKTWKTLLKIISQVMDLRELCQQIEDYLLEGK